jgi:hypothetical protein
VDLSRAITEFVKSGRTVFDLLRSEGDSITRLDLHILFTQLFILQVEARSLGRARFKYNFPQAFGNEIERDTPNFSPSITAMAAYLHVGDRLQAERDFYPARSGAIGRILFFKGMPENWYVVVEWEKPLKNFSREKMTNIWPISLKDFHVVKG